MKRVALYARVSTEKQAKDGDSISAQLNALRDYSKSHDYIISGEYVDDGVSGQKYQRDELQRLLHDVESGKIDIILVTKLDRLFRSLKLYIKTQEILDRYHVDWTAIWEPIYDTTTPSGRLIVNQMMSIAQFEAENTSQRIRQVFRYKAAKGEVLSGNQPFGFSIENKRLVPNQDAEKVVDLFNFFRANPCYSELAKYAHIKYGLTKKQANWKRMLQETKYIGVYKGTSDYCEPIIPLALFNAVQRQIQAPVKVSTRHTYIFSGIFFCAECGYAMNGTARTDGYLVYRCQRHFCAVPACDNQKTMFEKTLEKAEAEIEKIEIKDEVSDVVCDKCGAMMVYKFGRFGRFLACPNFPDCRNTKAIQVEIAAPCPECGGKLLEKTSRKGRKFYGCERYPECEFVSWEMPVAQKCPKCGGHMVFKRGRKGENYHVCVNENCRERVAVQVDDEEEE